MEVLKLETWINEFSQENINLDELKEYLDFIIKARDRYDPERYSEWHHIMPKCIDPDKKFRDQGVRINGRDHFLSHKILVSCFNGVVKGKLSFVLTKMKGQLHRGEITPEEYEEARKLNSEMIRGSNHPKYGTHVSEETRLRLSESGKRYFLTHTSHMKGQTHSPEVRRMISEKSLGRKRNLSDKTRKELSDRWKGDNNPSRKNDLSGANNPMYGVSRYGESNPMYGKTHSEETKDKIRDKARNRIWITDGLLSKTIDKDSPIPEGWRRGRVLVR